MKYEEASADVKKLFSDNTKLAYYFASKYSLSVTADIMLDFDDCVQCALMGLWKAAVAYDGTKGNTFATFAGRVIYNELRMGWRSVNTRGRPGAIHYSLDGLLPDSEDLTLQDALSSTTEIVEDQEDLAKLVEICCNGNKANKQIVELLYLGYNRSEITNLLGIHRTTVYRAVDAMKKRLSAYYSEDGIDLKKRRN